ncbi:MAG: tetratricopeptide repeat protein [Chloroflexi bacterium]|nr:tetratricopeptide repeat protein [Chloroflexota bacterium]
MTESKLSALCERFIEGGWLVAVAVAPLFFDVYSSRNVEPDKVAVLRALAFAMAAAWFVAWVDQNRERCSRFGTALKAPMVLPVLLVVAVYLLATVTSVVPRVSLFGDYVRPEGTYTMICYIVVFALIAQGLRTRAQLNRLFFAILFASFPVALYALIQKFGFDPLAWNLDHEGRVGAGVGNPIFLAAYLAMAFFITLSRIWTSIRRLRIPDGWSRLDALRVCGYVLIAVVQLAAFVFSDSRGPWLGWLGGLFLFALLAASVWEKRRWLIALLGAAAAGGAFLIVLNLPVAPSATLRTLPYLDRLGNLFSDTGSARVRTLIWQADASLVTGQTAIQYPDGTMDPLQAVRSLVGFGPDSTRYVFPQVYPAELGNLEARDTAYVRSHSETWDWLINAGVFGLLAYQFLFLSVFLFGLKSLGLVPSNRERNAFVLLWVAGGLIGGAAAVAVAGPGYLGPGIPFGTMVATAAYIVVFTLHSRVRAAAEPERQIILVACLAAIFSHYVETQFGIAVAATRVSFWVATAIIVAVGLGRPKADQAEPETVEPVSRRRSTKAVQPAPVRLGWTGDAFAYALVIATILATLLYDFCTYDATSHDPFSVLLRSLTTTQSGSTSYAIPALLAVVWLVGLGVAWLDWKAESGLDAQELRPAVVALGLSTLAVMVVFGMALAIQLSAAASVAGQSVQDTLVRSDQLAGLFSFYAAALVAFIALSALVVVFERQPARSWAVNRWSWVALVPTVLLAVAWVNTFDLNPIRADIVYKLGGEIETSSPQPDSTIALFKHAIQLVPSQDQYYEALAHALFAKSNQANASSASVFGDGTSPAAILGLDAAQTAKLNRKDLLFASVTMLLRAQDLNPLLGNYSVNLARFYLPALPADSPTKVSLAQQADQYYGQAARLIPGDVRLWDEWADFNLQYITDYAAAESKLSKSLQLDPKYAQTYYYLGSTYAEEGELDKAITAFQKALTLESDLADAESKLAYIYYAQGKLDQSVQAYSAYIRLAPHAQNVWEAHKNLALIYQQAGNLPAAEREGQAAARLAPAPYNQQLDDWLAQLYK